jgi:NADH-quinone oxidoreductase subunit J
MNGELAVFLISGSFSVIGALGMVVSRKAVHSALWVAFAMVNLAVVYFSLQAPFLGTTQIVVYTGAVMMLFLFVLMIVGVDSSDSLLETIKGQRLVAGLVTGSFAILLLGSLAAVSRPSVVGLADANEGYGGNVQGLARLIFGKYLLAFEVTSALLITAALGAMVLAHRERWQPRKTQAELSRERTLSGHVTPLPSPGVLATSNSVATPGLLHDGTPSQASLPTPFQQNPATDGRPEVTS